MRIATSNKFVLIAVIAVLISVISGCSDGTKAISPPQRPAPDAININTASLSELTQIPYVGERTAERIVAYRETNGPFRRPEDLLLVQGISDERFRRIRHLIRTE